MNVARVALSYETISREDLNDNASPDHSPVRDNGEMRYSVGE